MLNLRNFIIKGSLVVGNQKVVKVVYFIKKIMRNIQAKHKSCILRIIKNRYLLN